MKSMKEKVVAELKELIANAPNIYNYEIVESDWEKYGKSRTYFKVLETREHSTHRIYRDYGYIDNMTNEYHAGRNDVFGGYSLHGNSR